MWGLERGFCMMIGGEEAVVKRLDPIFARLAPGIGEIDRTPGREKVAGTAEQGYLHCGPNGAGHFIKMVHNGIEYGIMAAYAEGLGILRAANVGKKTQEIDAETTPLRDPATSTTSICPTSPRCGDGAASSPLGSSTSLPQRFWTIRGSPSSPARFPTPAKGAGRSKAAIDEAVPAPVLTTALYERFSSRHEAEFQDKLLSAMRYEFGGHLEKAVGK